MLEIEMKFRIADRALLLERLADLDAVAADAHEEADHYFNAPDRDFATTGEAFRLRRIGEQNILTYKGPREAGPVKTRREIEVPLAGGTHNAELIRQLLAGLSYRPVAVVTKKRVSYNLTRDTFEVTVCLDEVERVGSYAEVEIVTDAERRDQAQTVVKQLASELGLTDLEPHSYLSMLLAKQSL